MTSDAHEPAESAVKPQIIDLDAKDVTEEPRDAATEPKAAVPSPAPPGTWQGSWHWVALALVLGLVAGGWFYRGVLSSYLPTDEVRILAARVDALEANSKTVEDRLAAASAAAEQVRKLSTSLETAVRNTEKGVADASADLTNLAEKLQAVDKTARDVMAELDSLRSALSSARTADGGIDPAALVAIGRRLDVLEKDVASLKSAAGTTTGDEANSALRQALSDLKAKVAAGTPFRPELDRIVRIVPALGGNAILETYADAGLPNAPGLAGELRADIPTLPRPETAAPPANDEYWDSFWNAVTSIVTIRDVGETDWQVLAEACVAAAEANDLAGAIASIDRAEGALPAAIGRWRDRAAGRLKLEAAVADVARSVERVLAAKGAGQ
jgi:hypothetical protein